MHSFMRASSLRENHLRATEICAPFSLSSLRLLCVPCALLHSLSPFEVSLRTDLSKRTRLKSSCCT